MITLSQTIGQTDNRWNFVRVYDSIKILFKKKGFVKGSAYTVSLISAEFLVGVISYFCATGSYISLKEMVHEKRYLTNLRAFGDAGGWLSICIFAMIFAKSVFEGVVGEAEYLKCQSLLKKKIKVGDVIDRSLSIVLKAYASKCLFNKSIASQELLVMKFVKDCDNAIISSELTRINEKIQGSLKPAHYLKQVVKGGQSIFQTKGPMGLLVSSVMGIALPAFLVLFGIFSMVGEIGLGKELFIEQTSLDDTGHFGEWIINFFEAMAAAYILHFNYILNEGDYAITKEVYDNEIGLLKADLEHHDTEKVTLLSQIRNEELQSKNSHYKKID